MVRYALLGLLREQRDYGYRLKRRFDERVGSLWHLNIGQVYQTLRALQRAGLVIEIDGEPSNEPYPGRRMFELTSKGHRMLERWLQRAPARPRPVRDETLIRMLLLEPDRRELALARLGEQEQLYRRELTRLLSQKRRLPRDGSELPSLSELGLEAGILHAEAQLRWLERCREWLADRMATETDTDTGTDTDGEQPALAAQDGAA